MELDNLQEIWQGLNQKLDRNWNLNLDIIRESKLDKVRHKMQQLVCIKALALAFYGGFGFFCVSFAATHWGTPHFVVTGIILGIWAFAITATAIHELTLILRLDYNAPVTALQKQLIALRLTIINYLRLAVWIFPLYFCFVILFFYLPFGVDIVAVGSKAWLISNGILSLVVFLPLTIWMHRKLRPENADKKWMQRLLKGNGSQVAEALHFLQEIERFEK